MMTLFRIRYSVAYVTLSVILQIVGAVSLTVSGQEPTTAHTNDAVTAYSAVSVNESNDAEMPIQVGDLLHIAMLEDAEVLFRGALDASGYVILPHGGEFRIVGMTESMAAIELKRLFEKDLYQVATFTVRVIKRAPGTVYIYGAVREPGPVAMPEIGHFTVLQAVAQAKGITAWAAPQECVVTRLHLATEKREKIPVDLLAAFNDIGGPKDFRLLANDVVFIPAANAEMSQVLSNEPYEIVVIGQVNNPGIILFAPGELRTVMRAIFKAGHFTRFAKKKAIRLIRYGKDGTRTVETIDASRIIDEGYLEDDVELSAGDMIIVDEKLISF